MDYGIQLEGVKNIFVDEGIRRNAVRRWKTLENLISPGKKNEK